MLFVCKTIIITENESMNLRGIGRSTELEGRGRELGEMMKLHFKVGFI